MRILVPLLLLAAFAAAAPAGAQDGDEAVIALIDGETRYMNDLPGPQPGTTRPIAIWRAPSAPSGPLATLYMADGADGVRVAAARLRPLIEAGVIPAVQVIGLFADPAHRQDEYIQLGRLRYRAHERWVLETVIPWAERVARASPHDRIIGGYSNGAAFALFMAAEHGDVFAGVLAHSPMAEAETFHIERSPQPLRWALSAGRGEYSAYPLRAINVVAAMAGAQGGEVRLCTGPWGHDPRVWAELSPGSIAWLFGFANAEAAATPLEQQSCRIRAGD
jgi:hypothetical protein